MHEPDPVADPPLLAAEHDEDEPEDDLFPGFEIVFEPDAIGPQSRSMSSSIAW